nr:hypothetical protein [Streptomyces chartreusis]
MSTTRRTLSLDIAQYRRLEDRGGFFTSQQLCELLLRGYAAGAVEVDVPEGRKHAPAGVRGRVLVALSDDAFNGAEATAGPGRVSLLLDTLIAAYLDGRVAVTACATAPNRAPRQALAAAVPPAPADATA